MKGREPTQTQRIAIWRAYKKACVYCGNPIPNLPDLDIDHIIPRGMLDNPDELYLLRTKLDVDDLEIDSYRNWVPCHRACNRSKAGGLMQESSLRFFLHRACKHEQRVVEEEKKITQQAKNEKAFTPLVHLLETGAISKGEILMFIDRVVVPPGAPTRSEPLVVSFSTNVIDLLESQAISSVARAGPELYDWLEGRLEQILQTATHTVFTKIDSDRNGETVSVRYAFWFLDIEALPDTLELGWELLEAAPFSEVYPGEVADHLLAKSS